MIGIKCAGRNNFKTPLFRDFFLGLVTADLDVLCAAVHPPPDGGSGLLVVDGSDDPLQPSIEAVLGQREVSQL